MYGEDARGACPKGVAEGAPKGTLQTARECSRALAWREGGRWGPALKNKIVVKIVPEWAAGGYRAVLERAGCRMTQCADVWLRKKALFAWLLHADSA